MRSMESGAAEDSNKCRAGGGYGKSPPWLFQGSALYQLHLVKAETARSFIPKDLKLVEAFGYTLGGLFLARYNDSPAGRFDELVVIAGIVWNPPTSCAWAARVLVSSDEACRHGRKEVGLPSHVARFSKRAVESLDRPVRKSSGILSMIGIGNTSPNPVACTEIQVTELKDSTASSFCNINLPTTGCPFQALVAIPSIILTFLSIPARLSAVNHACEATVVVGLLSNYQQKFAQKYAMCRVRAVAPAKISGPTTALKSNQGRPSEDASLKENDFDKGVFSESDTFNQSVSVLLSKPILALEFNSLRMQVEAPTIISQQSKRTIGEP